MSYIISTVKPVLPIVYDSMAHMLWEMEHISSVHNHNGENHVHNEIIEADAKDQSERSPAAFRYYQSVDMHLMAKVSLDFTMVLEPQDYITSSLHFLAFSFLSLDYPPPKFH